ncbi:hypothetical protein Tco_0602132 [Tanacetum coccineum]
MPTATRTRMTQDEINKLIAKRVDEALKAYDSARNPGTEAEIENEQQDDHVEGDVNNRNGNGNRHGNPNVNTEGVVPVARECTYQDFMKCQPLNFKGWFDVIIGMDWLANNHAVIVCDEKIVSIPYGDEDLIVQGDRSDKRKKSTLSIISCTKTQKYINKGCLVYLAQVTAKRFDDELEEKRLEDVPNVRDFPEVFPEDLPGLPPM